MRRAWHPGAVSCPPAPAAGREQLPLLHALGFGLFSLLLSKGVGSSRGGCGEPGFEHISFVQPAPAAHSASAACGETLLFFFPWFFWGGFFLLLLMFKRGGEGRERMTIAQEDQLGSGPGAAQ